MPEIVINLRKWVCDSNLPERYLAQAIGELGTIFNLTQLEEDFILRIEEN